MLTQRACKNIEGHSLLAWVGAARLLPSSSCFRIDTTLGWTNCLWLLPASTPFHCGHPKHIKEAADAAPPFRNLWLDNRWAIDGLVSIYPHVSFPSRETFIVANSVLFFFSNVLSPKSIKNWFCWHNKGKDVDSSLKWSWAPLSRLCFSLMTLLH